MTLALALGADFLMQGRCFTRFDADLDRARNWQRYDLGGATKLTLVSAVSIVEGGYNDVTLRFTSQVQ